MMAVYKLKREGEASKFYVCEFVYQGKRFQESTGAISKTVAKEYEKRRKAEMERAAGLPTQQRAARIRTVNDVVEPYLAADKVSHRPKSILFAEGRLEHVKKALGNVVLSDLTDDRIQDYVRRRQSEKVSGRTIRKLASYRGRLVVRGASSGRVSNDWKSARMSAGHFLRTNSGRYWTA